MNRQKSNPCRFAFKLGKTGKRTRDTRHYCRPSCSWSLQECLDWCNRTPYPTATEPAIYSGDKCCDDCGMPMPQHYASAVDRSGFLAGIRYAGCPKQAVSA